MAAVRSNKILNFPRIQRVIIGGQPIILLDVPFNVHVSKRLIATSNVENHRSINQQRFAHGNSESSDNAHSDRDVSLALCDHESEYESYRAIYGP